MNANTGTSTNSDMNADTGASTGTDMNADTGTSTNTGTSGTGTDTGSGTATNGSTGTDTNTSTGATTQSGPVAAIDGYAPDKLMGASVVGADGNEIAQVSDVALTSDNKSQGVLVDVGGFLGIGAKTVELDPHSLSVQQNDSGDVILVTSLTKDQLKQMNEFQANNSVRLQSNS
jgi:hypothetical protein